MKGFAGRHAGLLIPLFSFPSSRSWGIGEIGDIGLLARWLRAAGMDFVQLLPVNEMAPGQNSPYSALSALAIDPIFISVYAVEDFQAIGGEASFDDETRRALSQARASRRVEYDAVRRIKAIALASAFDRFYVDEWLRRTERAASLHAFIADQAWWLDAHAVFRALLARNGGRSWLEWDEGERTGDEETLLRLRDELSREILHYQYLQWIADRQWRRARAGAGATGIFGDFPFTVSRDSADVWSRAGDFLFDGSVGTPPDAFSDTGQDWGLPPYNWKAAVGNDFAWLRNRGRRSAALFDGYRVDHLVGFYRTFIRPHDDREPFFSPADEAEQTELGERIMRLLTGSEAHIIAEDLGIVPDFVRASLAHLGIPGYRVFRWERCWEEPGQPFLDPMTYPPVSVATSGTHDTETMRQWWNEADKEERRAVAAIPSLDQPGVDILHQPYVPHVRDALLELLYASGANLLILPVQDIFGWTDRVNVPARVSEKNWTYRLPWPIDEFEDRREVMERTEKLRRWATDSRRCR